MRSIVGASAITLMLLSPSSFAEPVRCPEGSLHVEEKTDEGATGEWCEKDGVRDGPYILHEDGVLSRTGEFKQGKMSGLWRRYSRKGQLIDEGTWSDNLPDGTWTFFDQDGKITHQLSFDRGERVRNEPSPWILKRGQILGAGFFQSSGGRVGTGLVSYVPGFKRGQLTEWVGALTLGGLKSRDSIKPVVWVLSASAGMRLRMSGFERFRLEPKVGIHSWLGSATAASFHLDTGYDILSGRAAWVGGLEHVGFKVNGTTLIRFGFEYRFDRE